jgi:hypothetical protein
MYCKYVQYFQLLLMKPLMMVKTGEICKVICLFTIN